MPDETKNNPYFHVVAFVEGVLCSSTGKDFGVIIVPATDALIGDDYVRFNRTPIIRRHISMTIYYPKSLARFDKHSEFEDHAIPAALSDAVERFPDPQDGFYTIRVDFIDSRTNEHMDFRRVFDVPGAEHTIANTVCDIVALFMRTYDVNPQAFRYEVQTTEQDGFSSDIGDANWPM